MVSEHIVKAFDQELDQLKLDVTQMGGLAESEVESAIQCIVRRDAELAASVVQTDQRVDELEIEIDERAVRLLALRQPMASDLREVVAALKISHDLERIGDLAANLAKRAIAMSQMPPVRPTSAIPRIGRLAQEIIKDVLDAYSSRDLSKAIAAWQRDEELDDLYTSLFRETLTYMMEDPRNISPCTHLLFMAKNIERIGDHATNIAEMIHFLIEGKAMDKVRPKSDLSSYSLVQPSDAEDS